MDLAQMAREGKLTVAPGARLEHNGKRARADGTRLTQPSGAKRKAERRRAGRAARKARRR